MSIQRRDSNPRPSEDKSPPITTRPGLPMFNYNIDLSAYLGSYHYAWLLEPMFFVK